MMSYLPKLNVLAKATNNHIAVYLFGATFLQHLIAFSDYPTQTTHYPQSFYFAFAFQTGLLLQYQPKPFTKALSLMFIKLFSTSDFKVFFKVSFSILR